jgi:hypothetical protein
MNKRDIIFSILNIPSVFKNGDKSFSTLVRETRYFEFFNDINIDDIESILYSKPDLIREWMHFNPWSNWQGDKKEIVGWGFFVTVSGRYGVAYKSGATRDTITSKLYENEFVACVTYIKNELERIRLSA